MDWKRDYPGKPNTKLKHVISLTSPLQCSPRTRTFLLKGKFTQKWKLAH